MDKSMTNITEWKQLKKLKKHERPEQSLSCITWNNIKYDFVYDSLEKYQSLKNIWHTENSQGTREKTTLKETILSYSLSIKV